jgi:hypothetical protein
MRSSKENQEIIFYLNKIKIVKINIWKYKIKHRSRKRERGKLATVAHRHQHPPVGAERDVADAGPPAEVPLHQVVAGKGDRLSVLMQKFLVR